MRQIKRIFSWMLVLAVAISVGCSATAATAPKLTSKDRKVLEPIIGLFVDNTQNWGEKTGKREYHDFDIESSSASKVMADASVYALYYHYLLPKQETWMKSVMAKMNGELVETYTEKQVDQMAVLLFGKKIPQHGKTRWKYKDGKYGITGDRGDAIDPRIKGQKPLSNGDIRLRVHEQTWEGDYDNSFDNGIQFYLVLHPNKNSVWGYTIQKLTYISTKRTDQ